MACIKEDDSVIIRPPLFVYIAQTGFPLGTDLSKGTSNSDLKLMKIDQLGMDKLRSGVSRLVHYLFACKNRLWSACLKK